MVKASRERVLIAGCGYVGTALGLALAAAGHEVFALRRRPEGVPAPLRPVAADLSRPESLRALPSGIDLVFYTAAAGGGGDDAYRIAYVDGVRHLLDALSARPPRRFLFTSSTSVYAQSEGEWVDEESPTTPTHFSGQRLLEGEQLLAASGFDGVVVRLGGIYGPGRTRLIESVRSGRVRIRRGGSLFTNRIHRDDCAGALAHLSSLEKQEPIYLGVDHEPAEEAVVLRWLADRVGVPSPQDEIDAEKDEGASAGADTRRPRSNKRCRNARLLASGYRFRFPTFREGYDAVLRSMGIQLALLFFALAPPARADEQAPKAPPSWQTHLHADHPLVGVVWDVKDGVPITPAELAQRLARERFVLLGERHDQPDHHALQAWLVAAIAARGRHPAMAFEMFDSSQEEPLQRHLAASPTDAAGIGAAVGWEHSGWPAWSLYEPIAEAALGAGLPLVSTNLGREETRVLSRGGAAALDPALVERLGLGVPLPEAQRAAMEAEIVEGHCGQAPGHALGAMVEVQRARDAHMAAALRTAAADHDGAVLIAGNGHLRHDHAVPRRLEEQDPTARAMSVAILEVIPGQEDAAEYAETPAIYDYLWFTPRLDDEDACEKFKSALEGLKKR
jgi:nucleoside-diphosphate-sugar epimerase/uncharacterized iron-regulated protein